MDRSRTHYDLFGVGRNASTSQIRAAYLRLLKSHHPDVAAVGDAGDLIRLINRAYRALSDPGRRAAYDAELAQRNRFAALGAAGILPAVRRPQRQPWLGWAAISIAGLAAVVAMTLTEGPAPESADIIRKPFGWFAPTEVRSSNLEAPLPTNAAILEHARAGSLATPDSAMARSERCFANARVRQSLTRADLCIVFDDAYLYARNTPQAQVSLPPRFNSLIVQQRHSSILFELGAPETRLKRLWEATFAALMTEIQPEPPVPDTHEAAAPTSAPNAAGSSR